MGLLKLYGKGFYKSQQGKSDISAGAIVPFIVETLNPKSVIDVGCGTGKWCATFQRHGVPDVTGVDGPWVDKASLAIPAECFVSFDFETGPTPYQPQLPKQRYDLAVTFEFLEHVAPDRSDALVDFLTSLSDVVIAGAAIPGQGGTHHVNEQWPSYWREKFARRGYQALDFIRPALWDSDTAEPWHLQNPIGYFKGAPPETLIVQAQALAIQRLTNPAPLVHPRLFSRAVDPANRSVKRQVRTLLAKLKWKLKGR